VLFLIGFLVVVGSVVGSYSVHGDLGVLFQLLELVIIFGAACGALIISNPKSVLGSTVKQLGRIFKEPPHPKAHYVELLVLMYSIFRLAKAKGMLALEAHIENPAESALFQAFPHFLAKHGA
jgi:chemotaxis protein MotA